MCNRFLAWKAGPHTSADGHTAAMRMSGDFAATIAAVAPIVLLVAAVEVNNARPRMTAARDALRSEVAALTASAAGHRLTDEEADATLRTLSRTSWQVLKNTVYLIYLLASIIVAGALALAEYIALEWLATPNAGPDENNAQLLLVITSLSFVWVVLPPFAAVYLALMENTRLMLVGAWALLRIAWAGARSGDEPEAGS
ncbi:MAG: hypothetical protein QOC85_48 [Streptomyces sp.]|jgi:hypothetical protein|nr:hypothetical protein [Streptomyces sp.]